MKLVKLILVLLWSFGLWLVPCQGYSSAANLVTASSLQSPSVAGVFDFLNLKAQQLEGKIQEMKGKFTNDPVDQLEGKAKQVDAVAKESINEATAELKSDVETSIDETTQTVEDSFKSASEKIQKTFEQLESKAKGFDLQDQAEQVIEDASQSLQKLQDQMLEQLTE